MSQLSSSKIFELKNSGYFDESWYLEQYPDVEELGMDAAEHFLWIGCIIGRDPSPLMTNAEYKSLSSTKAVNEILQTPIKNDVSYIDNSAIYGDKYRDLSALVQETRLFDANWYAQKYQLKTNEDPLGHFVSIGIHQGFDPSESFSSEKYLSRYGDVANAGMNAFHHYLVCGRLECRAIFASHTLGDYDEIEEVLPDTFFLRQRERLSEIAIVAHVFYPEIWDEITEYLLNVEEKFDLYVSLVRGKSEHIEQDIRSHFPNVHILTFPNHGRDVFPFTEFLKAGVLDGYELVCKIHTKRSLHRVDGDAWRRQLYDGLLGSTQLVSNICTHMRRDPDVGMVVPDGYIYNAEFMGSNADAMLSLLNRVDLNCNIEDMIFPAGNMFWASANIIQSLKALHLSVRDYELEMGQLDGTMGHAIERYAGIVCSEAAQKMITTSQVTPTPTNVYDGGKHKLIAFYLPQYHPIPENDRWWGKGFTEWRNVEKALPSFEGHSQPRRPMDLGFYDLRVDDVRYEQAELAKKFGVDAFCYYHYWFDGKTLLDLPLNMMIESDIDFPFCICWANENWTRSWDGLNKDVLLPQTYDDAVMSQYPHDVYKYLSDMRYMRYEGKPIFLIYKIMDLPRPKKTISNWRKAWKDLGVGEVHIAAVRSFPNQNTVLPADLGVDAFVDFPPHSIAPYVTQASVKTVDGFEGYIYNYKDAVEGDLARYEHEDSAHVHRGVMGAWDNTARRGKRAHLTYGASPITYRSWLRRSLVQDAKKHPDHERLTFINAWNEWAEGTYLEPDQRYGIGFLEATRSVRALSRKE
jgi:Lipopolysaccharide biosynthesis protein